MPAVQLIAADLLPFAPDISQPKASLLITGVTARTALFAPSILADDFAYEAAAKDLLIVAVLRRYRSEGGVVKTETIGPYTITVDNSALASGGLYTTDELDEWARISRLAEPAGEAASARPVYSFPPPAPSWPDPAERYPRG